MTEVGERIGKGRQKNLLGRGNSQSIILNLHSSCANPYSGQVGTVVHPLYVSAAPYFKNSMVVFLSKDGNIGSREALSAFKVTQHKR